MARQLYPSFFLAVRRWKPSASPEVVHATSPDARHPLPSTAARSADGTSSCRASVAAFVAEDVGAGGSAQATGCVSPASNAPAANAASRARIRLQSLKTSPSHMAPALREP